MQDHVVRRKYSLKITEIDAGLKQHTRVVYLPAIFRQQWPLIPQQKIHRLVNLMGLGDFNFSLLSTQVDTHNFDTNSVVLLFSTTNLCVYVQ